MVWATLVDEKPESIFILHIVFKEKCRKSLENGSVKYVGENNKPTLFIPASSAWEDTCEIPISLMCHMLWPLNSVTLIWDASALAAQRTDLWKMSVSVWKQLNWVDSSSAVPRTDLKNAYYVSCILMVPLRLRWFCIGCAEDRLQNVSPFILVNIPLWLTQKCVDNTLETLS